MTGEQATFIIALAILAALCASLVRSWVKHQTYERTLTLALQRERDHRQEMAELHEVCRKLIISKAEQNIPERDESPF